MKKDREEKYIEYVFRQEIEASIADRVIEKEIFSYTNVNGVIHPKYPKYWNIVDNQATVYLRLYP